MENNNLTKKNLNLKNNDNHKKVTPELGNLVLLDSVIKENNEKISTNFEHLYSNVSFSITSSEFTILEDLITSFVNKETIKIGLLDKINSANERVSFLLSELKFFSDNGSYITGFFSSDFSEGDKDK